MATYPFQVASGSATASGDLGMGALGVVSTGSPVGINPTHLAYGYYTVDASGRVWVTGSIGITGNVGISAGTVTAWLSGTATISGNVSATQVGTWSVSGTALTSYVSGQVTAVQGGAPWSVSGSALTAFISGTATITGNVGVSAGTVTAWLSGTATVSGAVTAFPSGLVTSGSATASTDIARIYAGVTTTSDTLAINPTHRAYGFTFINASGQLATWGGIRSSAGFTNNRDTLAMAGMLVTAASASGLGEARAAPLFGDASGNLRVRLTADALTAWISGTATITGNVGISAGTVTSWLSGTATVSGQVTATAKISAWGASAVSDATAITAGMGLTWSVPMIGAIGVGYRSDGTSNYDPATLAKLYDTDTGANTENTMGVNLRVGANGGSLQLGCIDHAGSAVPSSGFVPGTSPVMPVAYIYDESAGSSLSEDDVGAARMDLKRAQVVVIEDTSTRGVNRRLSITPASALLQQPIYLAFANSVAAGVSTGASQDVSTGPLKYYSMQVASGSTGAGTCTATLQWSLDNSTFFTLLTAQGTNVTAAVSAAWPARYLRMVVSAAAGTSASASALGMN